MIKKLCQVFLNIFSISGATSSMEGTEDKEESVAARMQPPQIYVERTLAIIKPDAMDKADEIVDIILRNGFTILQVNFVAEH